MGVYYDEIQHQYFDDDYEVPFECVCGLLVNEERSTVEMKDKIICTRCSEKVGDIQETWIDLCKTIFPEWTDEQCDSFLWNETGFPGFWRTRSPKEEVLEILKAKKEKE